MGGPLLLVGNSGGTPFPLSGNCIFIKPHTSLTPPPTDQELIRIGLNSEDVKTFCLFVATYSSSRAPPDKFVQCALFVTWRGGANATIMLMVGFKRRWWMDASMASMAWMMLYVNTSSLRALRASTSQPLDSVLAVG